MKIAKVASVYPPTKTRKYPKVEVTITLTYDGRDKVIRQSKTDGLQEAMDNANNHVILLQKVIKNE